jgi:IclR family transcriptional regulator, pca regulon regulatory protein
MHEDRQDTQGGGKPTERKQGGSASDGPSKPRIRSAPDPRLSRSMEYGIAILESFSGQHHSLGIAELADLVGISRSTAHRYAMTLVMLGYLEQDPRRKYRLARRAAGPGAAAIGAIRREIPARAVLEELREQTGHTVSMGVLDGGRVVYIHRLFGHRSGQHLIDRDRGVGAIVPVHCTALGKILLASLPERELEELLHDIELTREGPNSITSKERFARELDSARIQELAISDEELVRGERSIAMLVPHPRGEQRLAIEVSAPAKAYPVERLIKRVAPSVKRAARLISSHSQ